ncbi:MAG: amidophosphoribosyltransferase [Halodesulfurarchaeum sp.]
MTTGTGSSTDTGPREKCGVVGVSLAEGSAALSSYYALYALQHRGQESAGIATHDGFQQHDHVGMGLVGEAFTEADIESLQGESGIGHVRYPTAGSVDESNAQPFTVSFEAGSLALSHNGNLINTARLRSRLAEQGHAFSSDGDTEVIAHHLARNLLESDLVRAVKRTMEHLHGSYALTVMHDDTVLGIRDPVGNRPLVIGELDSGYIIASESVAIDTLGGEIVRDVRPGELVVLAEDGSGFDAYPLVGRDRTAHCFFEHVYFARPDSVIDESLVYEVRRELGRKLWAEAGVETDVVLPVPDSGRAFASGYAEAAEDVDFAEGLMKNRYVGRTFIMPTQEARERAVRLKLNPIRSTVEDRTVTLIDDSIVRGTTSRQLVDLLRSAGAKAVHVRIGAPPIRAPCYMGIDMADRKELIAAEQEVSAIESEIGADSLRYLSIESVAEAIGTDQTDLCVGCVTGKYPYDIEGEETDRDVVTPSLD